MPIFSNTLDRRIEVKAKTLDIDPLFLFAFIETVALKCIRQERVKGVAFFDDVKLRYCKHLVKAKRDAWKEFDKDLPDEIFASLRKDQDMASDLSFISWDQPVKMIHFRAYMEGSMYVHKVYGRYPPDKCLQMLMAQTEEELALAQAVLADNTTLEE